MPYKTIEKDGVKKQGCAYLLTLGKSVDFSEGFDSPSLPQNQAKLYLYAAERINAKVISHPIHLFTHAPI